MSDREPTDGKQDERDGAEEKEQPDQQQVLKEREERLDPENRPDNVEVDNTDRTFDPETGFFEDRDEHDSAPTQFVDEEAISQGGDAGETEETEETEESGSPDDEEPARD